MGLEAGKYQVYAIAYDKAETPTISNEVTVKYNYYEWNKYSCYAYEYRMTDSNRQDRTIKTGYSLLCYPSNAVVDLDDCFDRVTGYFGYRTVESSYTSSTVAERVYLRGGVCYE